MKKQFTQFICLKVAVTMLLFFGMQINTFAQVCTPDTEAPIFGDITSITLFEEDFENPNSTPTEDCYFDLNITPDVNGLYGPGYSQFFTVETMLINGSSNKYTDPTGTGGNYSLGMYSTRQNDKLALEFNTQGKSFLNLQMDLSAIGLQTKPNCNFSELQSTGPTPTMRLQLYDNPTGSFGFSNTGTLLSQIDVTGSSPAGDDFTFNWAQIIAGLDASAATNGNVVLQFDLLTSPYASFDNIVITASDISIVNDCPENVTVLCATDVPTPTTPTATDNCDANPSVAIAEVTIPSNTNDRVITRTWTATDASGNSAECVQIITVIDTEVPMAVCQNVTAALDANGNTTISTADIDGGSDDACGFSLSASPMIFDCSNAGENTVMLTVTDNSGNSADCEAIVTILLPAFPEVTATSSSPVCAGDDGSFTISSTAPANGGEIEVTYGSCDEELQDTSCEFAEILGSYSAVVDENGTIYTTTANISCSGSTVAYSLGCSGVWTYNGFNGTSYLFSENITAGGGCALAGDVEITPQGDDILFEYFSTGGTNVLVGGVLNRTSDCTQQTAILNAANGYSVDISADALTENVSLYLISATNNGSCQTDLTGSATIQVNPLPEITNFISTGTTCTPDGSGVQYFGTPGATVIVSIPGVSNVFTGVISANGTVGFGFIPTPGDYTATITSVSLNGCEGTAGQTVDFSNIPTPTDVTVTSTSPVCAGDDGSFTISSPTPANGGEIEVTYEDCDEEIQDTSCEYGDIVGSWSGTISQGGGTYTLDAVIDCSGMNTSAYDLGCSGTWTYLGFDGTTYSFTENITAGGGCVTVVDVDVTPQMGGLFVEFFVNGFPDAGSGLITQVCTQKTVILNSTNGYSVDIPADALTENVSLNLISATNNGNCQTDLTGSATIQVNPLPEITNFISTGTTCPSEGSGVQYFGTPGATVVVSISGVSNAFTGVIPANGAVGFGFFPASGDYTATITSVSLNGCAGIAGQTVDFTSTSPPVISCPADIIQDSDAAMCGAVVDYLVTATTQSPITELDGFTYLGSTPDGNQYFLSDAAMDWSEAKLDAAANGGHLVTIDNAATNALVSGNQIHWIGLTDEVTEGQMNWVTGEPLTYTNWGDNGIGVTEPDDFSPNPNISQDYGITNWLGTGLWGDTFDDFTSRYILELEGGVQLIETTGLFGPHSEFPLGTTNVCYQAIDDCGLMDECCFDVTIESTPPVISCPADIVQDSDAAICGAVVDYLVTATSTQPITDLDGFTYVGNSPDGNQYFRSNNTFSWEAANANASANGGHLATISNATTNLQLHGLGPCWIGLTDEIVEGQMKWVTGEPLDYTAWWTNGIASEPDDFGPNPNLSQDHVFTNFLYNGAWGDGFGETQFRYILELEGGVQLIETTGNFGPHSEFPLGTTNVCYQAIDNCGFMDECCFDVTINDNTDPVALCQDVTVSLNENGEGSTTADAVNNGSTDACGIANLSLNITEFNCSDVGSNGVILTVTDNNGNSSTCNAMVNIIDAIPAEILCRQPVSTTVSTGQCQREDLTILPPFVLSDNCGIGSGINISRVPAGNDFAVGTTTLLWTVTDSNGNPAQCESLVIVQDNEPPLVNSCNTSVDFLDPGSCLANVTIDLEAQDACGIASVEGDGDFLLPPGIHPQTITVTDVNGNQTVHTVTVYVHDDQAPIVALCPQDMTIESSLIPTPVNLTEPQFSDNCGIFSIENDAPDAFPLGSTTVTYTAMDEYGNTVDCSYEVNVVSGVSFDNTIEGIEASTPTAEGASWVDWNRPQAQTSCEACAETDYPDYVYLGDFNGHQYFLFSGSVNWSEASILSAEMNGHLVSLNDKDENAFLQNQLPATELDAEPATYWTGLNDSNTDIAWENGDSYDYFNFSYDIVLNQDALNATVLNIDGTWTMTNGENEASFIMERPCIDFVQTAPLVEVISEEGDTTHVLLTPDSNWDAGDYTVTYEATDMCDNTATFSFDVNIAEETAEYCHTGGTQQDVWVKRVVIEDQLFESEDATSYTDNTEAGIVLSEANDFAIQLIPGGVDLSSNTDLLYWRLWLDLNNDGDFFDANEQVYETSSTGVVNLAIPMSANLFGQTLRSRISVATQQYPEACLEFADGEAEDYTLVFPEMSEEEAGRPEGNFSLSPNPADNYANLYFNDFGGENVVVTVYDNLGKVRLETKGQIEIGEPIRLNLRQFIDGIYFVRVQIDGQRVMTKRLVVDKLYGWRPVR